MAFPPDESKLVSIFIQTLLYGAYTVVFILTAWVLLAKRHKHEKANYTMLWISIVMFVMATMHIGVNFTRIIKAFIIFRNEPGGPAAFFNELSEFTQIFGSTIYIAQTLIGDAVALYRCYLVWGHQFRVIAFPALLLLGSTASGVGILYSFAKVVPEADIFVTELQQWIVSFFSLTLATNILCTGLVAFRIWSINRTIMNFASHSYRPVVFLVLESGAVYSVTLTALLVLYKTSSWFQYVLLDAISSIVGLVFSMIIVRIGLGITTIGGSANPGGTTGGPTDRKHATSLHIMFNRMRPEESSMLQTTTTAFRDRDEYYSGVLPTTTLGSSRSEDESALAVKLREKEAPTYSSASNSSLEKSYSSTGSAVGADADEREEGRPRQLNDQREKSVRVFGSEEV